MAYQRSDERRMGRVQPRIPAPLCLTRQRRQADLPARPRPSRARQHPLRSGDGLSDGGQVAILGVESVLQDLASGVDLGACLVKSMEAESSVSWWSIMGYPVLRVETDKS